MNPSATALSKPLSHCQRWWIGALLLALFFFAAQTLDRAAFTPPAEWNYRHEAPLTLPQADNKQFETPVTHPQVVDLSFDFRANKDQAGTVFRTSAGSLGLHLEQIGPGKLVLVLGEMVPIHFAPIAPLALHHFTLSAVNDKLLSVTLDDKEIFRTTRDDYTHLQAYRFEAIHWGYGTALFEGTIKNATLAITYTSPTPFPLNMLVEALAVLIAAAAVITLRWMIGAAHGLFVAPVSGEFAWLAGIAWVLVAGLVLHQHAAFFLKWNIALALGLCFLLAPLVARILPRRIRPTRIRFRAAQIVIAASLFFMGYRALGEAGLLSAILRPVEWYIALVPLAIAIVFILPYERTHPLLPYLVRIVLFSLIALICCAAFVSLQNWDQVSKSLIDMRAETLFLLAATATLTVQQFMRMLQPVPPLRTRREALLAWLPLIAFYAMAIRADTLFVDGSPLHWEYFVGPIRMVRNGGWLLWDSASQYGFLNTLLAALLPTDSALEAFYLFQAGLLFLAAILFYRVLYRWLGMHWLFAAVLVFAAFFLAYPPLIGPAPFPSSSAARFIACYVMLYWAARHFLKSGTPFLDYVKGGTVWWIFGVLWSAESAIYTTGIFLAPIALQLLLDLQSRDARRQWFANALRWLGIPVLGLLATGILITLYYHLRLGHGPDFSLFMLYGNAYSGGFGEMPIWAGSAIWVYGLLLFTGAAGLIRALRVNPSANGPAGAIIAAMGCCWVISTYYIGRAATNNVIAEYPLLCFCALIILRASAVGSRPHLSQVAFCLPLVLLAILSPLWNVTFPEVVTRLSLVPAALETHLDAPEPALAELIEKAGITPESTIVYYGNSAHMPGLDPTGAARTYEKTWLQNPPQMLEEPIAPEARARVVNRFMARHPQAGYFIEHLGDSDARVPAWLALIEQTHTLKQEWQNKEYRILYFVPKRQ